MTRLWLRYLIWRLDRARRKVRRAQFRADAFSRHPYPTTWESSGTRQGRLNNELKKALFRVELWAYRVEAIGGKVASGKVPKATAKVMR